MRRIARFLLVLPVVLLICNNVVSAKPASSLPGYVRLSLGGVRLPHQYSTLFYDPERQYCLWASGDCDGAHLFLDLFSRDSREYNGNGNWKPRVDRSLATAFTGSGPRIGDTGAQVLRSLGARPRRKWFHPRLDEQDWLYRAEIRLHAPKGRRVYDRYDATYGFRNGRLVRIQYELWSEGC